MILVETSSSGSVTVITNEPLSEGTAPSSNRMMKVVSAENVGSTLSTVSLTEVTFHTLGRFDKSRVILKDSIEEPLLSMVRVKLSV